MKFVAPEMELKLFSTEDILTASQESEGTEPTTSTSELFQPDCPSELPLD